MINSGPEKGEPMKWRFVLMAICVAAVMGMASPVSAADVAKIGVIDLQRVLDVSSPGKAAQAEINKKGKEMEENLKARGEEIEKARKDYERESLVMSKEARLDREREIRIKINDFKQLQKEYAGTARKMQVELVGRIHNEVKDIVERYGKKEGFLLIVEDREAGVFYAPKTIDITDTIIKIYNDEFAKKGN